MFCLHVCVSHAYLLFLETTGGCRIPWNWSYQVTMWLMRTVPGSSGISVSALNCWDVSPASSCPPEIPVSCLLDWYWAEAFGWPSSYSLLLFYPVLSCLLILLVVGFSSFWVAAGEAAQGFSVFFHCYLSVYTTDKFSFFVSFIYIYLLPVICLFIVDVYGGLKTSQEIFHYLGLFFF